jgi:hypothetical protein
MHICLLEWSGAGGDCEACAALLKEGVQHWSFKQFKYENQYRGHHQTATKQEHTHEMPQIQNLTLCNRFKILGWGYIPK